MAKHLAQIQQNLQQLASNPAWSAQQGVFLQHLQQTAQALQKRLHAMPQSPYALRYIITLEHQAFAQHSLALYGYARLLLDSPASFGQEALPERWRAPLQAIYDHGLALEHLTDRLREQTFHERLAARKAAATLIMVNEIIEKTLPLLHYRLRDCAVHLGVDLMTGLPAIRANAYHFSEGLQHIIMMLATDVLAYGHLQIRTSYAAKQALLDVAVVCKGTRLPQDTAQVIFSNNGRELIAQRLAQQGCKVHLSTGIDSAMHLTWANVVPDLA